MECIYDYPPAAGRADPHISHPQNPNLHSTPPSVNQDSSSASSPTQDFPSIASELEAVFLDNFYTADDHVQDTDANDNAWHRKIASFCKNNVQKSSDEGVGPDPAPPIQHPDILSIIVKEVVALVVVKFGSLGCHLVENGGGRFLVNGFRDDRTTTMFDAAPPGPNPLAEFGTRKITQIIDIWFSTHPLSFVLSKTLVMYELRRETLDETLLAVILADALSFMGDTERGEVLLRWAAGRLRKHPYSAASTPAGTPESPGGPPSIIPPPDISSVQILILLGWNALCRSQIRRATCYIGLACRLTKKLREYKWSAVVATSGSRINGIEVCEVEKEIVAYLWWISFTIFQWLFIQMDEQLPYLPRASLSSVFLPVDADSSVLIRLDEASDHISTLHRQKVAMLDMWPVAHVCSIIAYVYDLYPEDAQPVEPPATMLWQEAALSTLERLQSNSKPQSLDSVCKEVYQALIDNVSILNSKVERPSSRTFVLTTYHTMAIHVLFPRAIKKAGDNTPNPALTRETVERFCFSARELIKIIASALESLDIEPLSRVSSQLHPFTPDVFALALDTCSRAMSAIHAGRAATSHAVHLDTWSSYEPKLRGIATDLYELGQVQFFSPGPYFRAVKKQIELMAQRFGVGRPSCSCSKQWQTEENSPSARLVPVLEADKRLTGAETSSTVRMPPMTSSSGLSAYPDMPMDCQLTSIVNESLMAPVDGILHGFENCQNRSHSYSSELNDLHMTCLDGVDRISEYDDEQIMMTFDNSVPIDSTWSTLRQDWPATG